MCIYVGRDINEEEEVAVVVVLASAAVSTGVVFEELGPLKGHYHLQCLWRVCVSSTAAITSYIKQKVYEPLFAVPWPAVTCPALCCCALLCVALS